MTGTLYLPAPPDEAAVAEYLERRYDAAWFRERRRWAVETDADAVYIALDFRFGDVLEPDVRAALPARLGFTPRAALHVHTRWSNPAADAAGEEVLQALRQALGGRALAAA